MLLVTDALQSQEKSTTIRPWGISNVAGGLGEVVARRESTADAAWGHCARAAYGWLFVDLRTCARLHRPGPSLDEYRVSRQRRPAGRLPDRDLVSRPQVRQHRRSLERGVQRRDEVDHRPRAPRKQRPALHRLRL